jgi:hypothetical protein
MQSGIPFKLYMAKLLMGATPMGITTDEAPSEPVAGVAQGRVGDA